MTLIPTNSEQFHELTYSYLWKQFIKLQVWIQQNGMAGYDPYDIKENPLYLWLNEN